MRSTVITGMLHRRLWKYWTRDLSEDYKKELLLLCLPTNVIETRNCLSVLGMDDFLSLFNQKRPKILRNKINEKLLNAFKNRNWIKNFTVDETDSNYFRAYGRKIQGVSEHENVS